MISLPSATHVGTAADLTRSRWARVGLAGPAAFAATATALTLAHHDALRTWGWTALDHHGVPWPSSLAVLPFGWLQSAAFVAGGLGLGAVASALPRGTRRIALAACGAGMVAAAFPLDLPAGDPAELSSWVQGLPAAVHVAGFAVAGLAGLVAVAASRRRRDLGLVAVLALAATLGGAVGWYGFLAGFFSWVAVLGLRVGRTAG